jgi:hypothetical protein
MTLSREVSTDPVEHGRWERWMRIWETMQIFICEYIFFLWRYRPNSVLDLPPWNFPFHFSLLDLKTDGRTPWTDDQLVTRPLPVQKHRKTHIYIYKYHIHALSGIRTHDPSFRASKDSACLRTFGYKSCLFSTTSLPILPRYLNNWLINLLR